ncbi:MAG: VOC family protein [Betaproteobacteria bacterium]|nr:VOC family protein [Betaproteobacteria bacterium]
MNPQPLIAVRDVKASSRWYQAVLGFESGHGGAEYEQLMSDGRMVMQIHHWDVHEHPHLGNPDLKPSGNGVLLWFQADNIEEAFVRAKEGNAELLETLKINRNANHREFWLRDPDGYVVVVAGAYGDTGASK